MSNIRYVVTEESAWKDSDLVRRGFNTSKGTVCGIFYTKEEALMKIDEILNCPLYKPFAQFLTKTENHAEIHDPDILDLKLDIHEHDFDSPGQYFSLKEL